MLVSEWRYRVVEENTEKKVKKERRTESGLSLDRLEQALSKILSRKEGCEVTVKCYLKKEVKD